MLFCPLGKLCSDVLNKANEYLSPLCEMFLTVPCTYQLVVAFVNLKRNISNEENNLILNSLLGWINLQLVKGSAAGEFVLWKGKLGKIQFTQWNEKRTASSFNVTQTSFQICTLYGGMACREHALTCCIHVVYRFETGLCNFLIPPNYPIYNIQCH